MLIGLSNVSNLIQYSQLPVFQTILAAIFVTIATVKVKLIPDIYTNKLMGRKAETHVLFFSLEGAKIAS